MYIKHLELAYFKSFGGTTAIPLLPGFTVVSGPNGSGKSNILDALLFALGLSSSKGMRAERLPDLVNHSQISRGRSVVETSVTVTFDLSDPPVASANTQSGEGVSGNAAEWRVTRKLRVTQQGTYTSNYAINGESCTLQDLHEQLSHLRIYPEGYNVVLQGDVTGIISMNSRQRREIIDELAGVADFDRKITQAKEKLDQVKEREDRFRIIENELILQRDRLERDRVRAEKYQRLRSEIQSKSQWEAVLLWRSTQVEIQQLEQQLQQAQQTAAALADQATGLRAEVERTTAELEHLNAQVKALGEDEHLALQSALATRSAEYRQLARQQQELEQAQQATLDQLTRTQQDIRTQTQVLVDLSNQRQALERQLVSLVQQRDEAQQRLDQSRHAASTIAAAAETWVQQQTGLRQQVDTLLQILEPQRAEQARLGERAQQLERQVQDQGAEQAHLVQAMSEKQADLDSAQSQVQELQGQVRFLAEAVAAGERDCSLQQETQARLQREQREKQRQLDKLEAQQQAVHEAQGTYATRLILQVGLPGVFGLVAQLGRVEPQYQVALEIAAGARLSHLVVEDDAVAAAGIELLKRERAGRVTFLPLDQMQPPRGLPPLRAQGAIDYALRLIDFEPRYQNIFAYVFGSTVVFETLSEARRYLGQYRIVTLAGELLETSGAMTGGSRTAAQSVRFGSTEASESAEVAGLKARLQEIEQLLDRLSLHLATQQANQKQQTQALMEARQRYREIELRQEQLTAELAMLSQRYERSQSQQDQQQLATARERLGTLDIELPRQEAELQSLRSKLAELEQSQAHSEWQQIQAVIRAREAEHNEQELACRSVQQRLQDLETQQQRVQTALQQAQTRLQEQRAQQTEQFNQRDTHQRQRETLETAIAQLQADLTGLEQRLGTEKQLRDRAERQLREHLAAQQQLEWQQQKLQGEQQTQHDELAVLQAQLQQQATDLPEPLPAVPAIGLEQLRQELRSQQKQLQAMEPVNMLAIEDYERTQERLAELTAKLTTLAAERTELLLRIENFTTLRHQAFREAFNAVNQNFQTIFAELSDGDGYLQLEDPQDPFRGGLNLVAHPKGKPVQRLASMSGGEKSLTALSFIFALQRYRPSPFYAFDEVDMFLDGANVERLSRMIWQQAQQAQFIVVSLRRPMIEAAERTIGVTQARGTHTQVLGLRLQPRSASLVGGDT